MGARTDEAVRAVVAECRGCGRINAFVGLESDDHDEWIQRWFNRGDSVRRARVGEVVRIACTCPSRSTRDDAASSDYCWREFRVGDFIMRHCLGSRHVVTIIEDRQDEAVARCECGETYTIKHQRGNPMLMPKAAAFVGLTNAEHKALIAFAEAVR